MSRFVMNDIWRKLQNNDACDKKSVNNIAAHQTEDKSRSSCAGCVAVSYHLWHQVLRCKSKSLSLFPVHLYSNTSISADNDLRFHLIIDSGVRWDWNVCAGTDAAFTSRFLLKKKKILISVRNKRNGSQRSEALAEEMSLIWFPKEEASLRQTPSAF